jgi:toxin secretion/phage lysis holin
MEGKVMENKKSIWSDFKGIIATIGGFIGWALGGGDGMLLALVALVAIDYITCVLCGVVGKSLAEYAGIKVIANKIFIFVLVAVGYIIDTNIIGEGSACRMAVIFYFVSNEGISVLENAAFLGVPFPEKLKDMLLGLNDKAKPEDGEDS